MSWETVIGLEVHVQLATRTKMFCGCPTSFGDDPNTNVCPVCLGLPGALPVPNRTAIRLALRAALALDFTVHPTSIFARKNYFYPDLPKGYQITQFDRPLATQGRLSFASADGESVVVSITRLHLEEDAGKSIHDRLPGKTAVDCNRAGVPLVEIVTEPVIDSPANARAYLVELKRILQYLEVSDCNMEEGHLRVDANLSVRPAGSSGLGVKQEVKNMNSFATVERALEELRDLQVHTLEQNAAVEQATYGAATSELRVMRSKEATHDYRYFPEPDLPPLVLPADWVDLELATIPELPAAKRDRFVTQYEVSAYDAQVLSATPDLADYFEAVVTARAAAKTAANWVMGAVLRDAKESDGALRVPPERLAELIRLVADRTVSNQAAKQIFRAMTTDGDAPAVIAGRLGVLQVRDDSQLGSWVEAVLAAHPDHVGRFRGGEKKLLGFFMGRVMQESGGKADPKRVNEILREKLAP
ncbi:MAG: Asp-tRNA(Asn)/Glu-tRNA(Gln) amidotransferase subunit GatB [Gemmatimonadetes bacterium]|nr:Asp-tRNA(Asn)/Glu-tRNA(Gln) amidotransferase subunit GatB [Gemmatimonadota bacterium]